MHVSSLTASWLCYGNRLTLIRSPFLLIEESFASESQFPGPPAPNPQPPPAPHLQTVGFDLPQVVKETLRLYPAGPLLSRVALDSVTVGPQIFPKGTIVFMSVYAIHRDPHSFPDPGMRWLSCSF